MRTHGFASNVVSTLLATSGIALSTTIAWTLFQWMDGGTVDVLFTAAVRGTERFADWLLAMDPVVVVFVFPLGVFTLLGMGIVFFSRQAMR